MPEPTEAGTPPHDGASMADAPIDTSMPDAGGSTCDIVECFRPIVCVLCCGGPATPNGCCPCLPPWFDEIACSGDATCR